MPELPEVETIVRDLASLVAGRRIEKVRVGLKKLARNGPRRLSAMLTDQTIDFVQRHGKFIVIGLSRERFLIVHLKMTGQFLLGNLTNPWPKHVHIVLELDNGQALMYRDMRQFGYFLGLTAEEYESWLTMTDLGPDPFQIEENDFADRLAEKKRARQGSVVKPAFSEWIGKHLCGRSLVCSGYSSLPAGPSNSARKSPGPAQAHPGHPDQSH